MAGGPYGELLEAVRGVRWPARRAVSGGSSGIHLARTRGVASEFAEYRPYRQGDDPRRLDWKLLARSDRAFTRLAPDHSVLSTLIAVDASASMAYPARIAPGGTGVEFGKWLAARRIAVACAAIAHAAGDPVGLAIASAGGLTRLPSRTRRGIVAEIARTLDATAPGGSSSLIGAFVDAGRRVLLISDCLGEESALRNAARTHIASGGEVHLAHIVAHAEIDPGREAMLATDPEDARIRRPLTRATRAAYEAAFAAWRSDLARRWRDHGVTYSEVRDDEPLDVVVRRVVAPPGIARART
ncbi:MAG TPA: DUF58 domain-containing protein [Gemmatimonadaceae bacterium]|nr:DUF58 domain-containing protein [Gemmatimonadaceae bacterium]